MTFLFLAVVFVLAVLAVWLVRALPIEQPYKTGLLVVVLVTAILFIVWKLGAFNP